jgi:hypothetical protein
VKLVSSQQDRLPRTPNITSTAGVTPLSGADRRRITRALSPVFARGRNALGQDRMGAGHDRECLLGPLGLRGHPHEPLEDQRYGWSIPPLDPPLAALDE